MEVDTTQTTDANGTQPLPTLNPDETLQQMQIEQHQESRLSASPTVSTARTTRRQAAALAAQQSAGQQQRQSLSKKRSKYTEKEESDNGSSGSDDDDDEEGEDQADDDDDDYVGSSVSTPSGARVQWVQCDRCEKWRTAPASVAVDSLPDTWHCALNTWDPSHADCSIPQETQDEEIWPGLPGELLSNRSREDFYYQLTRFIFPDANIQEPYPTLFSRPVDLYRLYAVVETVMGGKAPLPSALDAWMPVAERLEFPSTDHTAGKLRFFYTKYVVPFVAHKKELQEPVISESLDLSAAAVPINVQDSNKKPRASAKRRVLWTAEEDAALRAGIEDVGHGKWKAISESDTYGPALSRHNAAELRNRWRGFMKNRREMKVVSAEQIGQPLLEQVNQRAQNIAWQRLHPQYAPTAYLLRRPYPVNVVEMEEQKRNNQLSKVQKQALNVHGLAVENAESDSEASTMDTHGDGGGPRRRGRPRLHPVDGDEAEEDDLDEDQLDDPDHMFYYDHRTESLRLSPTLLLPLSALYNYFTKTLRWKVDAVYKLLRDLWDEPDMDERRRCLSDCIYQQFVSDEKRRTVWQSITLASTQHIRRERKERWQKQLQQHTALVQQTQQITQDQLRIAQEQAMSVTNLRRVTGGPAGMPMNAATPALTTAQMATPTKQQSAYFLPPELAQLSVPTETEAPTTARRRRKAGDAVSASPSSANGPPAPPDTLRVYPVSPTIKARTLQLNQRALDKNAPRGPYFTSRKKATVADAQIKLLSLMQQGLIAVDPTRPTALDDTAQATPQMQEVLDQLPANKIFEFVPPGVKVTDLLALVESTIDDNKKPQLTLKGPPPTAAEIQALSILASQQGSSTASPSTPSHAKTTPATAVAAVAVPALDAETPSKAVSVSIPSPTSSASSSVPTKRVKRSLENHSPSSRTSPSSASASVEPEKLRMKKLSAGRYVLMSPATVATVATLPTAAMQVAAPTP